MNAKHRTEDTDARGLRDIGTLTCPGCSKRGRLGSNNFCVINYNWSADEHGSMSTTCSRCGTRIPLAVEHLALSDELYFAVQAFLGPGGVLRPLDKPVCTLVRYTKADGTHQEVSKGTVRVDLGRKPSGGAKSPLVMTIGERPVFEVMPGVTKVHTLPAAFETVLPVKLDLREPSSLVGHVSMVGRVELDPNHENDTLVVMLTTDSLDRSSREPCNVLCHVYGIPIGSRLRPWARLYFEAIGHTMNGMHATAILDYARASEAFVEDYIQEILVETRLSSRPLADKLLHDCWRISDRIKDVLPLIFEKKDGWQAGTDVEWKGIKAEWGTCVATQRNSEKVTHGTHELPNATESHDPSLQDAEKARKSVFLLIRGMQKRCPVEKKSMWSYWLHVSRSRNGLHRADPGGPHRHDLSASSQVPFMTGVQR